MWWRLLNKQYLGIYIFQKVQQVLGLFLHHLKEDFKSFPKIYTFIINESTALEL